MRGAKRCEARVTRVGFIGTRRSDIWQPGGHEGSWGECAACRWARGRVIRSWAEIVSALGRA
jgi:hypothetical protein